MIGTDIAHYKVTTKLGQGGMGEVYRATDTKLDREVAIKVLPEGFTQDKERLARFDREAKALASLNHPNIAGIYGVEQEGDVHALVMELVEGEDLSTRIKHGPLPVEEALDVCKQIAEALEAAHEKGIIHRDLKPANVKLTEDGKVKVLDFGLAKATATESSATSTTDSLSPTITADYTMPGTLLGTAAYMSPEQARGKPVDKRSDIWSFGCVLYECLTGKRMFQGEDVTETLATIIKGEPDWTALPENTPPTIHLLLRKCLAKDRKRRLRDIGDAIVDLEQAIADPSSSFIRLSDEALQETKAGTGIQRPVFVGAILGAALVAVAVTWFLKPGPEPPTPPPIRHMPLDLEFQGRFTGSGVRAQLSPDGSTLAFLAIADEGTGQRQLFIKPLGHRGDPTALTAADGVFEFSFSPDGKEIVFRNDLNTKLRKVFLSPGGSSSLVCPINPSSTGIHWASDRSIVFGSFSTNGVMRVSSNGTGSPEPLTSLAEGESGHLDPHLIPDNNLLLFTARRERTQDVMVQRLDQLGQHQILIQGASSARYIQSTGHLLFKKGNSLFAAAYNPLSPLEIGEPVPVGVDGVSIWSNGAPQFDFSHQDGSLVYLASSSTFHYQLEWIDRAGNRTTLTNVPPGDIIVFRLSPDGNRLAYSLHYGSQSDIWILNLLRGSTQKLTTHDARDGAPVWSPDGQSIVFVTNRDGPWNLYWKSADTDGDAIPLTTSPNRQIPFSWHSNGQQIIFNEWRSGGSGGSYDMRILDLEHDGQSGWTQKRTTDFVATPADEGFASFSPDGRWVAYSSGKFNQSQVYVRHFDPIGSPVPISIEGLESSFPLWSPTTNELFFATREDVNSNQRQVYVTTYQVFDGEFIPGTPVKWEGGTFYQRAAFPGYDLHPDGTKLLVRKLADVEDNENQSLNKVVLFENFTEHLRKIAPTGKQ